VGLVLQTLVGQVPAAALYALTGVGFVMVYRTTRVVNFAQGILAMLGGYTCYSLAHVVGIGFWPAVGLSILIAAVAGAALYWTLLRPLIGQDPLLVVMLTIAIGTVLAALGLIVWGADQHFVLAPVSGNVQLPGGLVLARIDVALTVTAAVLLGGFALILKYTSFGAAMHATAENPTLATLRGINVGVLSAAAWGLAVVFAAIAGIAFGASSGLTPGAGEVLGFAAFPAIILGGMDSVSGALLGALVLAEIQGLAAVYVGGLYVDVVGYIVLLLVLVVRPTGLFGSRDVARI